MPKKASTGKKAGGTSKSAPGKTTSGKKTATKQAPKTSSNPPTAGAGKPLVIVESPTKANTIRQFLGGKYHVEASIGHIRDLPEGKRDLPAKYKQEPWAYLGVNVESDFEPVYIVPTQKREQVKKLKDLVKQASELYLATDEDREGEAISWHLQEILQPKVPVHRMVFHEITQQAIQQALSNPRTIDESLVRAQETRRILDRLYGYDLSQLLRDGLQQGNTNTAGRVQSVALRLLVDRERERMRFVSATYWDLLGLFAKQMPQGASLEAELRSVDDKRIPTSKDFDPETGQLNKPNLLQLNQEQCEELRLRLLEASFTVSAVEDKPQTNRPHPPFTTSTLQKEANRRLRFSARKTMQVAQVLYERGFITYMRTDSTALSNEAVTAARDLVRSQYGPEYLPDSPRLYTTKVKNAQEAHEAIRPSMKFTLPEQLKGQLNSDELQLYDLIWKRTVACQMADAKIRRLAILVAGGGAEFRAAGKAIDFWGYMRAYVEGSDDPEAELADKEKILPKVEVGEALDCRDLTNVSHTTQPPARYTDSSLVDEMEKRGIGRPSTYAETINKLLSEKRGYGFRKGNALVPTWKAIMVIQLLEQEFPTEVDYAFTAQMLEDLDAISRGERDQTSYLRRFYFGDRPACSLSTQSDSASAAPELKPASAEGTVPPQNDTQDNGAAQTAESAETKADTTSSEDQSERPPGLKPRIDAKKNNLDAESVKRVKTLKVDDGTPIILRVGKNGPYLTQEELRADVPGDLPPDELTVEIALKLLEQKAAGNKPIGHDPATSKPVYVKQGPFGPYVQLGSTDDEEKPKRTSLLKGMQFEDVTLEIALKLLELPRTLGDHPDSGNLVQAGIGRFGPFIKHGSDYRSLPADLSPMEVTLPQALELLAKPKRRFGAPDPVKTYEASPDTKEPVALMPGRKGGYFVSSGGYWETVPKDLTPEQITQEQAHKLIKEGIEKGQLSKKAAKKKTAKKAAKKTTKTATKKKATKKATKKTPAKKKAVAKKGSY